MDEEMISKVVDVGRKSDRITIKLVFDEKV